eukprot:3665390-Amphidinium_carterae.1
MKENIDNHRIDDLADNEHPQNAQFFNSLLQSLSAPSLITAMADVLQAKDCVGDQDVPTWCDAQAFGVPSRKTPQRRLEDKM